MMGSAGKNLGALGGALAEVTGPCWAALVMCHLTGLLEMGQMLGAKGLTQCLHRVWA